MTYTLDVELFIREVKKFPELWDQNCENNRYQHRKQAAWAEIAKVFISDFEEMPGEEKMDVYKKLQGKWRNIRDSYVRQLKRKNSTKKKYMYAKHLSFLKNQYSKHVSDSDADGDHNYWSDEDTNLKKVAYKSKQIEISDSWQSDEETTIDSLKRKGKKEDAIEYVDTPLLPDATCSYTVEDEDKSFFDSLLPAVRNFNMDQKLEFRSEVICLIKNIRRGQKKIKLDPETGDFNDD